MSSLNSRLSLAAKADCRFWHQRVGHVDAGRWRHLGRQPQSRRPLRDWNRRSSSLRSLEQLATKLQQRHTAWTRFVYAGREEARREAADRRCGGAQAGQRSDSSGVRRSGQSGSLRRRSTTGRRPRKRIDWSRCASCWTKWMRPGGPAWRSVVRRFPKKPVCCSTRAATSRSSRNCIP